MRVLIVYASHEGQTAKIAHEMAGALRMQDHEVQVSRAQDAPSPQGFDAAILGSPVHMGKHDPAAAEWVKQHHGEVENTHGAFFSVSLAAASKDQAEREEAKRMAREFLSQSNWNPELVACFAGALAYSQYGWIKRALMRRIAAKEGGSTDTSHDYEYTDWDSVVAFARDVVESASAQSASSTA